MEDAADLAQQRPRARRLENGRATCSQERPVPRGHRLEAVEALPYRGRLAQRRAHHGRARRQWHLGGEPRALEQRGRPSRVDRRTSAHLRTSRSRAHLRRARPSSPSPSPHHQPPERLAPRRPEPLTQRRRRDRPSASTSTCRRRWPPSTRPPDWRRRRARREPSRPGAMQSRWTQTLEKHHRGLRDSPW